MSEPLCGDYRGEDGWFSTECDLPPGHAGDHHAVVTWPPREPTEFDRMTQRIWAYEIIRQLDTLGSIR